MPTRAFEMTIDLDATPEDVWHALTDAGELMRWFSVQASVTPGPGGTMVWQWDDHFAWKSRIEVWEPGKRLVLTEERPPVDIAGAPLPGVPHRLAMEFTLETHAGRTRLRLVHSGFGHGDSWDDELDGISGGWQFELRGLRFYLERHKGRDRIHAAVHRTTALPIDAAWRRLFARDAFVAQGLLEKDEPCTIDSPAGRRLQGTVLWHDPGRDLAVIVDDGLFRISTWRAAGRTGVQVWLTTYDPARTREVREFGQRIAPMLDEIAGA